MIKEGETPLTLAASCGSHEIVKMLLLTHADINSCNKVNTMCISCGKKENMHIMHYVYELLILTCLAREYDIELSFMMHYILMHISYYLKFYAINK